MQKIIKSIIVLIFIFSIGKASLTNADYFENFLNLNTGLEELQLDFYTFKNPNLQNPKYQKQYQKLNRINPIIKDAIIKQYNSGRFGYYQATGLITHYNNFIYYSNKYFSSIKNKEVYGNSKEIQSSILKNLRNMKFYYIKFQNLAIKKNMN